MNANQIIFWTKVAIYLISTICLTVVGYVLATSGMYWSFILVVAAWLMTTALADW